MFGEITANLPLFLLLALGSIFISLSIHEAMHGFTAHWLGDDTAHREGRLTLNPLAHIDVFTTVLLPLVLLLIGLPPIFAAKPVPFNPDRLRFDEFGAALVAAAGPFTNLLLAIAAAGIFQLVSPESSSFVYNALMTFIGVNIGFFVFNMIPFPPLDGSRVLYAVAPEPVREIMEQIEGIGFLGSLMFIYILFQFAATPIVNVQSQIIQFLVG